MVVVIVAVEKVNVAAEKLKNWSKFVMYVKKCESSELGVLRMQICVV
jgi:hypothetical protein